MSPEPEKVREIARTFLTDPDVSADELGYVVRSFIGYVSGAEHTAWCDAVRADADEATVVTTATWPDEQPQDERDGDDMQREMAIELVGMLVAPDRCRRAGDVCEVHGYSTKGSDCPHALARAFLAGAKGGGAGG